MTSFRMFEIILYSMVSLLPYLGLALYPFEDKFRMSKIKLSGCIVILTVIQSALGIYATMCSQEQKALFSLLSTVCYGGFYFLAIKENVGKLVFVLLIVSNFANFVVMCAKCVEGHIFPQLAVENNKWSFSLCTMIVQLIFIPLLFLYFKKYIKELGIKEENYKSAVILIDEGRQSNDDGSKTIERLYKIKNGDKINVAKDEKIREITITKCTDNSPMGQETVYHDNGKIIVSEDFMREVFDEVPNNSYRISNLLIESKKAQELENRINDLIKQNEKYFELEVQNYETYIKQEQRSLLVIKIFLYGFITVITLIGVTNIFNTITTNMILRSKEFAMLKSIGMTTKEFNRMIRLESIMYGTKSLLIGIPLGILGSYGIYKAFAQGIDLGYMFPYQAVIISIIFVFIIVGITMKYSLNRINKQNIIETIRKDNI